MNKLHREKQCEYRIKAIANSNNNNNYNCNLKIIFKKYENLYSIHWKKNRAQKFWKNYCFTEVRTEGLWASSHTIRLVRRKILSWWYPSVLEESQCRQWHQLKCHPVSCSQPDCHSWKRRTQKYWRYSGSMVARSFSGRKYQAENVAGKELKKKMGGD